MVRLCFARGHVEGSSSVETVARLGCLNCYPLNVPLSWKVYTQTAKVWHLRNPMKKKHWALHIGEVEARRERCTIHTKWLAACSWKFGG